MKITKDEAFILWRLIIEVDYSEGLLSKILNGVKEEEIYKIYGQLEMLENKLILLSEDKRRKGRKSQNSTTDIFKRYKCKKLNK